MVFAANASVKSFKQRENIRSTYQRKYKNVGVFHKVACSGRKHFISKWNYAWELQFWINLIDRVTQHDFVDTNFRQSCSKIEISFVFNCQTKRTIVALLTYPKIPSCQFFLAWRSNICLSTLLRNPTQFPHNRHFLPYNLPLKTRIIFFFSHTLSEGLERVFVRSGPVLKLVH